jgi:hypothetical protein
MKRTKTKMSAAPTPSEFRAELRARQAAHERARLAPLHARMAELDAIEAAKRAA